MDVKKMLKHINKVAGKRISKFPKHIQEDALHEAIVAYLQKKDIIEHLVEWNRNEREYQKKILTFTRARPLKRDKEELREIEKRYR